MVRNGGTVASWQIRVQRDGLIRRMFKHEQGINVI